MHGILFKALKDYVIDSHGDETWQEIRREAGIGSKIYLPVTTYDDDELIELIEATADVTDSTAPQLLEPLGVSIARQLLDTYGNLVRGDWSALDLIENTEEHIHTVLRTHNPELTPPELVCDRQNAESVTVRYRSDRQLCAVAKGIARGVGAHYEESLSISEVHCMHDGDDYCELVVSA